MVLDLSIPMAHFPDEKGTQYESRINPPLKADGGRGGAEGQPIRVSGIRAAGTGDRRPSLSRLPKGRQTATAGSVKLLR